MARALPARYGRSYRYVQVQPVLAIIGAVCFSLFAVAIPWEKISASGFVDIENYEVRLALLRSSWDGLIYDFESYISLFTSELTWLAILRGTVALDIATETMLVTVATLGALTFGYFGSRHAGLLVTLALLTNPAIIDLINSQVRSVLAMSLFYLALMLTHSPRFHYAMLIFAATIHTSMLLVLILYAGSRFFAKINLRPQQLQVILIAGIILVSLVMIGFGSSVLASVGDRRSFDAGGSKSLLFMGPWMLVFLVHLLKTPSEGMKRWEGLFATMVLGLVCLVELVGVSLFRLIPMSLPLILVALTLLRPLPYLLTVGGLLMNNALYFLLWL